MAEKFRTLSLTPKRNFLIKDNECTCAYAHTVGKKSIVELNFNDDGRHIVTFS